eukprot:TRINITY_DN29799_c0_g1_i1.p1 TRINITY_DN29799_c0_g1~~TRINITY_DN29799_c0_g1_i1.p1  ORF type:complete len:115 (-),score=28.87 TRINITY_DN29799_c0_g1_i1:285-629(-)
MFGWGESEEHANTIWGSSTEDLKQHEPSFFHEMIAGAAGFSAMRAYEQHEAANGKPQSYALFKEILAGFAAAEVDKMVESKGLDWIDSALAKRKAVAQANKLADEKYGGGDNWF